jgi:hypothetical protein
MNVDELIHKLKITEEENTKLKYELEDKTIQLNKYLLKNIKYYEKYAVIPIIIKMIKK